MATHHPKHHEPKAAHGFKHGHHGPAMHHHKGAHHAGKALVATPSNMKALGGKGKA